MSPASAAGTVAMTSSVEGSYTSSVLAFCPSRKRPSMYIWYRVADCCRSVVAALAVLVIGPSASLLRNSIVCLCRCDLPGRSSRSLRAQAKRVVPHVPGHTVSGEALQEGIRIKLFWRHDAGPAPGPGGHQPGGDHRRNSGLVCRRLHAESAIGSLVVAHIVNEERLRLSVLVTFREGADAGLSPEPSCQLIGLRQEGNH